MWRPHIVITRNAYDRLQKYVYATDFQHETGGVLIGYNWLRIFYVVAFTFPQSFESVNATKMTFVLNGEEHTREMEKIRSKYFIPPKLIGVWHSHITEDVSFSLQDKMSNKLLVNQVGEIVSMIVIQWKGNSIRVVPYCISRNNSQFLCKVRIADYNM